MENILVFKEKLKITTKHIKTIIISSFWIYFNSIPIIPIGAISLLIYLIIRKRLKNKMNLLILFGMFLGYSILGLHVHLENSKVSDFYISYGFRIGEISTTSDDYLELFNNTEDIHEKIDYLIKADSIKAHQLHILNEIGLNYLKINNYSVALEYFTKAKEIDNSEEKNNNCILTNNIIEGKSIGYYAFGTHFAINDKNYKYAYKFLTKSLELNNFESDEIKFFALKTLAICYLNDDKIDDSKFYIDKAIKIDDSDPELIDIINDFF